MAAAATGAGVGGCAKDLDDRGLDQALAELVVQAVGREQLEQPVVRVIGLRVVRQRGNRSGCLGAAQPEVGLECRALVLEDGLAEALSEGSADGQVGLCHEDVVWVLRTALLQVLADADHRVHRVAEHTDPVVELLEVGLTARKGTVLATKAVETQGKCSVLRRAS